MNVALRSEHLNLLSICTGGGGLDLGVELAIPSARSVCMVEREAFAVATLVSAMEQGLLHPAPVWGDARTFDGRAWRGCVDGLIGGIPCQPHSLAGRKQGSNDARDLWSTARRIIVQSGAWFVVIENVGGMLAAGADEIAGAQRVFRDLSKLGFEVEGGLFTAAEVGASHQRERIIILAVADRDSVPGVGLADAYSERLEGQRADDGALGRQDARRSAGLRDGTAVVDTTGFGRGKGRTQPKLRGGWPTTAITGGAVGDPARVVGTDFIDRYGRPDSVSSLSIAQQAEMVMGEVPREIYLVSEKTQRRLGFDPSSLRDQLTYPVGATLSHPRRSLNPLFVEWLMGWPPAWTLAAWTDFACSETALFHFKQHMRSALLQLGLPREAPPAQLALFG